MPAGCPGCGVDHVRGAPDCPEARLQEVLGGKYRLEALVGSGGCGAVYRAAHVLLETPCAVKMLLPRFARDARLARRFLIEAKTAASLKHPGIAQVTDYGAAGDGAPYLVMELLDGRNLSQVLKRRGGPLRAGEAVSVAVDVLEALSVAHAAGVVHRDLKPENLMLVRDADGVMRPKILDFGIAKVKMVEGEKGLTATGDFVGTLRYASPEQITSSKTVDERADVYSLGAVVFFLLTGRSPIEGRSTSEVLSNFVSGKIARSPAAQGADVPEALDAIVSKALALHREDRFRSAKDMLAAFKGQNQEVVSTVPTIEGSWDWLGSVSLRWRVLLAVLVLAVTVWCFARLVPRGYGPPERSSVPSAAEPSSR
ncbi:MAG: serine/threonine-protein kinase [Vicinamibacteria bacterium]